MKKILMIFMSLGLAATSVGCSSSGDVTDISNKVKKWVVSQQTGLISGAQQNFNTAEGYKVSSSRGAWSPSIQQTTAAGYKVYSSVQGNIASETSTTTVSE